jgi:transposase InsO family protein
MTIKDGRWASATTLATQLVLDALNMARITRRPNGVIHHSDQGSQYTSIAFGHRGLAQHVFSRPARIGIFSVMAAPRTSVAEVGCTAPAP